MRLETFGWNVHYRLVDLALRCVTMAQAFLCAAVCILLIMAAAQAIWPSQLMIAFKTGQLRFKIEGESWNFCGPCMHWSDDNYITTNNNQRHCRNWPEKDNDGKMKTLVSGLRTKGMCCKPFLASRSFRTLCYEWGPQVLDMHDAAWFSHS